MCKCRGCPLYFTWPYLMVFYLRTHVHCVNNAGGCVVLCLYVNIEPLCCDRVNPTIASVVFLGDSSVRIGGVEVINRMVGQGGGGVFTAVGSLG
jgi:hypothetical protein